MKHIENLVKKHGFLKHWFVIVPPIFYFYTMARVMTLGDVALMIERMVNIAPGIHPNLHNLSMYIGNLFIRLPFGTVVFRATLMAVIFGAAAAIAFYYLLLRLKLNRATVLISSFAFMISHSVWWHSTMAENYIVHVFPIVTIIICFVDYYQRKKIWPLYLSFFLAGLSFFNHVQNGVWWGACYLFLLFYIVDIQKNGKLPFLYKKIFGNKRNFVFIWVFLMSSFFLFSGLLPYIILFIEEWSATGWDLSKTIDTALGGEFSGLMLNFENLTGFRQSFWYHFLQFPSPFFFLTIAGLFYFVFGELFYRFIPRQKRKSKVEDTILIILILLSAGLVITNIVLFYQGTVINIGGRTRNWFRYDGSIKIFISNVILALFFFVFLARKNFLKSPLRRELSRTVYSLILIPFIVSTVFFQFYNTWDQFAFLLPCYVIYALLAAVVLDDIVELLKTKIKNKSLSFTIIFAIAFTSIIIPPYFYDKIGEWSEDPSTWWFHSGPYSDRRFWSSHNRSEYNNNPNKRNYTYVDDFLNLLFEKLPHRAVLLDDDSRMFYPIHLYYRKYADREDKGRPDIHLKLINVWGHKNWGTSVNRVVREINALKPGKDNYFLIASRNYPHRNVIKKLDSNERVVLPWKLSNDRWIYKVKVFTEKEKEKMTDGFPPLNFHYMFFGKDFDKNGLNKADVFNPADKIYVRARFDRLPKKIKPFNMLFSVYNPAGKLIKTKPFTVEPGWRGIYLPLELEQMNLKNGTYETILKIKNIEIFRRSFDIKR